MREQFVESYKNSMLEELEAHGGPYEMGSYASHTWRNDPRHLLFSMARYKFCAKMLEGKKRVLEVGCGDGFCLPIMLQTVDMVHGTDIEPTLINQLNASPLAKRCEFTVNNMIEESITGQFDAAYSLDVLEHIPLNKEKTFMQNICASLNKDAICIIGTPNITADQFASPMSRAGHVNLKSGESLRKTFEPFFKNTFIFSMNDEVVHTGYTPMAHYLIAVGVGL